MNRACTRLALGIGLFCILLVSSGFSCHASSDDPMYYNPPTFKLEVYNDDSVAADVYVDTVFQDVVDDYGLLIIPGVPENIDTELYAEAQDGSGDWGPDIVDTRYEWTYEWILDPIEWFTLTVTNTDIYVGATIYVDGIDCGPVPADDWVSITDIPTNADTEIEVVALDYSWTFGPTLFDTRDTGTGYAGELEIIVPLP